MDPAYLDYLLFAAGGFALAALGFATAWLRARERAIRAEVQLAAERAGRFGTDVPARVDLLEQLAEGTALEVERIAEAQRFQAKLLAGRAPETPGKLPEKSGRVITPH